MATSSLMLENDSDLHNSANNGNRENHVCPSSITKTN